MCAADGTVTRDEQAAGLASGWIVLYDGNCGLCKWLLAGLLRWDHAGELHPIALQRAEADALPADLTPAQRMASWHLIAPGGERRSGGAAVAPLLRLIPAGRVPAAVFACLPGPTDVGYRWVAEHRTRLSRWVPSSAKRHAADRVRQREEDVADQGIRIAGADRRTS